MGASNTLHYSYVLFPPCVEKSLDAANMSVRATRSARTLACRLDTRVETRKIKGLQCIRKLSDIAHECVLVAIGSGTAHYITKKLVSRKFHRRSRAAPQRL